LWASSRSCFSDRTVVMLSITGLENLSHLQNPAIHF
jgi:hypothetical protein